MDLNTSLFIAFAVMMLFCCGGLGRLFSRNSRADDGLQSDPVNAGTPQSGNQKESRGGGCCH